MSVNPANPANHPHASLSTVTRKAVGRALRLAIHPEADDAGRAFWIGYAKGAADMDSFWPRVACKAHELGPEIDAATQAAWAALNHSVEGFSNTDIQQRLAALGIQIPLNNVATLRQVAVQYLDEHKCASDLHDDHRAAGTDVRDGAGLSHDDLHRGGGLL